MQGFENSEYLPRGEEESGSDHLLQPLQTLRQSCGRPSDGGVSSLGDMSFITVLNQTFRTLLHTRLRVGLDKLRLDPSFKGDVIVIEPREHDVRYFNMNPVAFWDRTEAALLGFKSVRASLEQNYTKLVPLLRKYGLETDLDALRENAMSLGLDSYGESVEAARQRAVAGLRLVR